MSEITLKVNKKEFKVDVDPQIPILWVLRDHLKLVGTKFCAVNQAAAALANAIYAGVGIRIYSQPFSKHGISLV